MVDCTLWWLQKVEKFRMFFCGHKFDGWCVADSKPSDVPQSPLNFHSISIVDKMLFHMLMLPTIRTSCIRDKRNIHTKRTCHQNAFAFGRNWSGKRIHSSAYHHRKLFRRFQLPWKYRVKRYMSNRATHTHTPPADRCYRRGDNDILYFNYLHGVQGHGIRCMSFRLRRIIARH